MSRPGVLRIVREPTLHFGVVAGLLFVVHHALAVQKPAAARPIASRIVISKTVSDALIENQQRRTGNKPRTDEARMLVRDLIKEQLLFDRAVELRLDRGDPIVRRRLIQKMELALDGTSIAADPTDAQLQQLLSAHSDKWTVPATLTFEHMYFASGTTSGNPALRAAAALSVVRTDPDHREGDAFPSGTTLRAVSRTDLDARFGPAFARSVEGLEAGTWHGPISSAWGLHLVRITAKTPARLVVLSEVRTQLVEDWREEQRRRVREDTIAKLREKYEVVVEDPTLR